MGAVSIEKRLKQRYSEPLYDALHTLHHAKNMPVNKMSEMLGCSRKALTDLMDRLGVERKSHSELMKLWWERLDDEQRQKQVEAAHKKNEQLASEGNLSFQRVWREKPEEMREQARKNALKMCKNRSRNAMKGRTGPKHHLWNPNKVKEERIKFRKTEEHYAWVRAVYERDSYTCQLCEYDKGGTLNAHHLDSYADHPEVRHEVSNGVTLCKTCHVGFHRVYGYGGNTRAQFDEYRHKNACKPERS